ncbi:outer membrane lipoprotein-sorting protein [Planctomycetota bacterium]
MRRPWTVAVLGTLVLTFLVSVDALALTGREIVERFDQSNRSEDETVELTMDLVSEGGLKHSRRFLFYFKTGKDGDDRLLIRFLSPADIKGTGFLNVEQEGHGQQWLYLPDLKKSKRVAGSSRAGSFVESDFSNYDVGPESLDEHEYKLLGEVEVDGRACYKVEGRPKTDDIAASCGYSRRVLYVDKERWTLTKVEFTDRSGKALKVMDITAWIKVKERWRGERIVIKNQQDGSQTIVEFQTKTRKMDQGVKDGFFSKRTLEKP